MKKTPKTTEAPKQQPIIVALPNTAERKMEAITTVARALEEVAKALNGVNTNVTVANCHFENIAPGPAIVIGKE